MIAKRGIYPWLARLLNTFWRFVFGQPLERYSRITPNLYLGAQPSRRAIRRFYDRGILGIVNMRGEYDYAHRVDADNVQYLYLPTTDYHPPTVEDLSKGAAFIKEIIDEGGGVFVHCREGVGRGPTMAAAYLVSTGMTTEEAWDLLKKARPFVMPTRGQRHRLEDYAEQLAETPVTV